MSSSSPALPAPVPLAPSDLEDAARRLAPVIHPTRLQSSRTFGAMAGGPVWLKPESLQKAGSWKIRGAYATLSRLDPGERARGVVTFSSGNWAQGVAAAAQMLGIRAVIVLPEGGNERKRNATRGYGAEVVVRGRDSEELRREAARLAEHAGLLLINPLDNRDMIVGAATVGLEIVDERPDTEMIFVPVGGGALIAGVAAGAKLRNPGVRIVGVQARGADAVYRSLREGRLVELPAVDTIAEGLAVKRPSADTVALIGALVDEMVLVSDREIEDAMYLLLERAKLLVEPSGAAALAGVLCRKVTGPTVAVLTGGNADFAFLTEVLRRPRSTGGDLATGASR